MKLTWEVPRATRTYLVQQMLGAGPTSAKTDILARFAGFFASLRKSVAVLAGLTARDLRSTTGKNIKLVHELSGLDPWEYGSARIKDELAKAEEVEVPAVDQWRISYLQKLLEQRQMLYYGGDKEGKERMSDLIDSLCVN